MAGERPSGAIEVKSNTPTIEKKATIDKTCIDQQEAFKKTFEEGFNKGMDVLNQNDYDKLVKLLEKYNIGLDLSNIDFNSLNNGIGITIKKIDNIFKVYNLNNPNLKGNLTERGVIENGLYKETGTLSSLFSDRHYRTEKNETPQDIGECVKSEPKIQISKTPPPVEKAPEKTYIEHKIKPGEYLWKIISEKYGLGTESDKNAIWQIMEEIRKDPRNKKAIKNIDTIFAGETLYLPKPAKIKQGKGKPDKEIPLK